MVLKTPVLSFLSSDPTTHSHNDDEYHPILYTLPSISLPTCILLAL